MFTTFDSDSDAWCMQTLRRNKSWVNRLSQSYTTEKMEGARKIENYSENKEWSKMKYIFLCSLFFVNVEN